MKSRISFLTILIFILVSSCQAPLHKSHLEANFKNPPDDCRPRTWMHAMSQNMSKEGITNDLEAMAEVGIGGLLLFNIAQGIPLGKVVYNSPEHHAILKHAAAEAERLGLSFGIHNCDGWSSSDGPWITPENSIKMVVWSEQLVQGGKVDILLKEPTRREGFYKDIAVIAYPALASELSQFRQKPTLSTSDKTTNIKLLHDGLRDLTTRLQGTKNNKPWVQFSYKKPFTARAAFALYTDRQGKGKIYTSNNGKDFTLARTLHPVRTGKGEWAMNDHFEPITAKHFRFVFENERGYGLNIKEIELRATYLYDNPLGRTAMARTDLQDLSPIGKPEPAMVIDKSTIKNLSKHVDANGQLKTTLPRGNWTILRFGFTSTGAFNHPASDAGRGLESDKLSKEATEIHFNAFCKKVVQNGKPVAPNAMQYLEIDSYEMGGQNWTDHFDAIFQQNKGYNLISFLPLYAGRFIDNAETTEAVLWDVRDVICDLMAENYFGYFTELCHQNGVKSYIEPYGFGPVNELEVGGKTDIPMGEFWMNRDMPMVPPAVSAAHIYGKAIVSAESFTSTPEINWKGHPAMAKTSGDKAWARGINEFMFHRFAHQANTHVVPGMTMSRWGFHMDRTQTWWYNAGAAWFRYLARGSYLLRQGIPVSDLLVFVGESAPHGTFSSDELKNQLPKSTNFDNVNADVILNRISVKNKELVLPEGTSYKALALKNHTFMSLAMLQKLHSFSKQGILIMGSPPKHLAGYGHTQDDKIMFKRLIMAIWGNQNTYNSTNWQHVFDKHHIIPDLSIKDHPHLGYAHRKTKGEDIYFIYNPDSIPTTFTCTFRIRQMIPELWDAHTGETTKLANFVSNGASTTVEINMEREGSAFIVFRDKIEKLNSIASLTNSQGAYTPAFVLNNGTIKFEAPQNGSYHIAYADKTSETIDVNDLPAPLAIDGGWNVSFNQQGGYETHTTFPQLIDWRYHADDGIQHYSGTATYRKQIDLTKGLLKDDLRLKLDLGDVSIVAEVTVNGKNVGVIWKKPFIVDISDAVHHGTNDVVIKVTNQWSNRLIGDERYPANDGGYRYAGSHPTIPMPKWYTNNDPLPPGERSTFTTASFYKKSDPLLSSGLIGPVSIIFSKVIELE